MTNCQTCKDKVESILLDLPSSWRFQISESICKIFDDLSSDLCGAVKKCETITELSEFRRNGSEVCITYMDEDNISYERCFDFQTIINSLLDTVDPKCLAPIAVWRNLSFSDRIQLMINTACNVRANTIFTTTSTTSTSSTSTTSTSTSTTTSSTTTTTTETPVCGCFSIENLTPSLYPAFYNGCSALNIPLNLDPGQKKYVCSTFDGITQSIDQVIETKFLGDCSLCAQLNATTTTTSTSTTTSSTTTTTTVYCDPFEYICVTIKIDDPNNIVSNDTFITVTQPAVIFSNTPFYNNITLLNFGSGVPVDNYIIAKNTLTNCWELRDPGGNIYANYCSNDIHGFWSPIYPEIISMSVGQVDQFLQCIAIPPTTTTTTSTSSTTTTTTEDPCNIPGNPGGIIPFTTTTSTTSTSTTTTTTRVPTTTTSTTTQSPTTTTTTTNAVATTTSSTTSTSTSSTTTSTTVQPVGSCSGAPCYRWDVYIRTPGAYVEYFDCNGLQQTKTTNGIICVCGIPSEVGDADVQIVSPLEVCTSRLPIGGNNQCNCFAVSYPFGCAGNVQYVDCQGNPVTTYINNFNTSAPTYICSSTIPLTQGPTSGGVGCTGTISIVQIQPGDQFYLGNCDSCQSSGSGGLTP